MFKSYTTMITTTPNVTNTVTTRRFRFFSISRVVRFNMATDLCDSPSSSPIAFTGRMNNSRRRREAKVSPIQKTVKRRRCAG